MKPSTLAVTAIAVVALAASAAWAGTKFQTNLVPGYTFSIGPCSAGTCTINNTKVCATNADCIETPMSEKSKMQIKDTGSFQAKLQGIEDDLGDLITGDGSFDPKKGSCTLTGDEYFVVQTGTFPALATGFQFNLVAEVSKGKAKAGIDASALFSLIPNGVHKAVNVEGIAVYGPVGDQTCNGSTCPNGAACTTNADCPTLADCQNNVGSYNSMTKSCSGVQFVLEGFDNPCIGGQRIGVGGILIP